METQNKQKYIEARNGHIDDCKTLCWTPSKELSKEVKETLDKLKELVVKVAENKGLKGVA